MVGLTEKISSKRSVPEVRYIGRNPNVETSLTNLDLKDKATEVTIMDADQSAGAVDSKKIIVGRSLENKEIMELVGQGARHVIQMPNLDFDRQMGFCSQIVTQSGEFFDQPRKFLAGSGGLSLIDKPEKLFHYPTGIYQSKEAILQQVRQDLDSIPRVNTIRNACLLVADEMLLNILKDAPAYFAKVFPDLSISGRTSSLSMAYEKDRLLLWTEDDFGSLVVDKLLKRLRESYQKDQVQPLMDENEGAGLGCRIIFDLSVSMSMFVKPGHKTVFCALLPLGLSNRKQQLIPKNLHIVAMTF
jgi:hypothetical protein